VRTTGNGEGAGGGEQRARSATRGRRSNGERAGRSEGSSTAPSASINWKLELADATDVSIAFLDATVKGDPVAREWLQKDAQRWLGDLAQLTSK
jgi:hypothetical protein